jgi:ribosomal protein L37AE/L43A
MDATSNGYRFAELALGESLQSPTVCDHCGREDLKRTIKLINPEGRAMWIGGGCAARLMGVEVKVVRAAKKVAEDRAYEAEQAAKRAAHRLEDAAWQAFLDRNAPGLDRYDQIRALGGMAKARELLRQQSAS